MANLRVEVALSADVDLKDCRKQSVLNELCEERVGLVVVVEECCSKLFGRLMRWGKKTHGPIVRRDRVSPLSRCCLTSPATLHVNVFDLK